MKWAMALNLRDKNNFFLFKITKTLIVIYIVVESKLKE